MNQQMYKYFIWICSLWLLSSACAPASVATPTPLPTATISVVASPQIETTVPIATLTPSPLPVITETTPIADTVDALASQTVEGYYQIGNLNAPITMVDYSDFF